jgi:cyanate lyase
MKREEVTQKIIATKTAKGLKWADVAARVGRSKEWTTAALRGQMPMSKEEAEVAGAVSLNSMLKIFDGCRQAPTAARLPRRFPPTR